MSDSVCQLRRCKSKNIAFAFIATCATIKQKHLSMPHFPPKLQVGDCVRVIAPSQSLGIISKEIQLEAARKLNALGLEVTYGAHVHEQDEQDSTSVESRLTDLHEAFFDPNVKAIFSVIGGYNANQLLPFIDWQLIKEHPKAFIGYSDTTALQNAMLAKADLVTYSGPAFSTFGQKKYFEYTLHQFREMLFLERPKKVPCAETWTDDEWYIDQDNRHPEASEGRWVVQPGSAEGTVIGGNLSTFALLQGTPYFPRVKDPILFIEGDVGEHFSEIERRLESLLQALSREQLGGIVIGRFPKACNVSRKEVAKFFQRHVELRDVPVIANVDFGHTNPMMTFPIGGSVRLSATLNAPAEMMFC